MKGCRLRACGEKIELETEDGKKEYELRPLKNKQLLEVVEVADKKEGVKAAILMAKFSLNASKKIVEGIEEPFTDEEMEDMDTPFLLQILKIATKINGLEEMFDFQLRAQQGMSPSQPESKKDILNKNLELLNQNPSKKL